MDQQRKPGRFQACWFCYLLCSRRAPAASVIAALAAVASIASASQRASEPGDYHVTLQREEEAFRQDECIYNRSNGSTAVHMHTPAIAVQGQLRCSFASFCAGVFLMHN